MGTADVVLAPTQQLQTVEVEPFPIEVMHWLVACRSASTRDTYRRIARVWLDWCDLVELDWLTVQQHHIDLWRETMTLPNGQRPAGSTIAQRIAALSSLYGYLARKPEQGPDGQWRTRLPFNPAADVRRPVTETDFAKTPALTSAEGAALLAAAAEDGPRSKVVVGVLLTTAVRVSELVEARVEDLTEMNGFRVLAVTRKGGKRQHITLPQQTAADVDRYLDGRAEGPLLATRSGKPMDRQAVHKLVRRLAVAAGIDESKAEHVGPHALRRTGATILLDQGAPVFEVQDLLGHADPRTTGRYNRSTQTLSKRARHVATIAAEVYPD